MGDEDQQYARATKAVDDAMRTDVLGPKVCTVLNEHLPTNELLESKLVHFINDSSQVKDALALQIKNNQSVRLGKWIERAVLVVGSFALTLIGKYVISRLT